MSNAPKLKTRRPTGKPPWPVLLIAGVEKTGKSYGAALFSTSDLIDRTIIVEFGEGAADQYGAIDGARYEIAIHDGTYASILEQIEGAVAEPRTNGKPHAIVVDNVTELWDMLSDEAQLKANQRARAKAANERKPTPVGEAQITMDLWNVAKKKWRRVIDALRVHDGPVILLARLESVAVMDGNAPAKNGAREWKVRAEKNLPFECDAIVKMTAPQECYLTGVRSVVLQVPPGEQLPLPQFTIDGLLRRMGLDAVGATAPRSYTAPQPVLDSDEEPSDRPAQRERGQSEDEWTTAGPALATQQQMEHLAQGLMFLRGAGTDEARATAYTQILGRPVAPGETLTRPDAERVRLALVTEDEQRRTVERQEAAKAERDAAEPAPAVADRQEVDWILGGLTVVRGITDPQSKRVAIEYEVHREVPDPYQLTVNEAAALRATLEGEHALKQKQDQASAKPTQKRKNAMHAAFNGMGITDHTERVAYAGLVVGHAVASTNELSAAEVEQVIEALNAERTMASFGIGDRAQELASMIASSQSSDELAEVSERFWQAHEGGEISDVERDVLISASGRREQQLAQQQKTAVAA